MINVRVKGGTVIIADNKNKKPDKILMFIEIKAKNEINKQTMKYTIIMLFQKKDQIYGLIIW